jgi:membrane protein
MMIMDILKNIPVVISGTSSSFQKNNDLTAASSLAFSATLALIPVLFLLTLLLDAVIGSSRAALAWTQDLLNQLIPAYSQEILREVRSLSVHRGTVGLVNGLVLLWSMTPLVADMRICLGAIFQKKPSRPFLLEKLFDAAISIVFLTGLSVIAVAGIVLSLVEKRTHYQLSLGYLEGLVPFLFVAFVLFAIYLVFSTRARLLHLLTGALAAASLWFAMRPVFHLFLIYNPGYGFAFGSFKSLFVVIIWIYCSFVAFLIGAEIAASLGRNETVLIRRLMEGGKNVPAGIIEKYVRYYEKGSVIFREGEQGMEM